MPIKSLRTTRKNGASASVRKKAVKPGGDLCLALFEWGADPTFHFDRVGRCLDVNPSGCRLLGLSRRRIRNRTLTEILLSPDGSDGSRQIQSLRRGQTTTCRLRICRNDGREVAVDVHAKGLAQGGKLVVLREQSVSLPIYEQLQDSERFLDSVLEHLPNMVFIKDAADLRFVRFNKAGEELLGYSRDELLGKNDYDFFPKHEADFFTAKDREVLAGGRLLDIAEEPIQTRAHGLRLLHTKKIPIRGKEGQPQYLLGLSEDITEQYSLRIREIERGHQLRRLSELTLMMSGDPLDVFEQAVRIIGELFDVKVVCLSQIVGPELHFRAVYVNGQVFRDAGRCSLAITPCATVEMTKDLQIFDQVMERFPEASFLKDHQAVAYCGFPAMGRDSQVVAVTCLLDDKPRKFSEQEQNILRIFGQRIAYEIERGQYLKARQDEQKKQEEQKQLIQSLFNNLQDGVLVADAETGRLMMANDVMCRMLGVSQEELIQMSFEDIHPVDQVPVLLPQFHAMAQGKLKHVPEVPVSRKDGSLWFADIMGAPVTIQNRPCVFGTFRDITERKQADEALRLSEARLEFLLSATPAVIYSAKPSGDYGVVFISDNVTKILGYAPDEFIADSGFWASRIHPDDRERVFSELPNLFKYGTFVHEYRFLHQDGTYRWLRDELQVIGSTDKQPRELVGCMTDITNRKQAEILLVDSEARFRHMVEHLPIGLASVDEGGVMTMVNAEMEHLFGYRRGELIGQSIDYLVPHRYRSLHVPSREEFVRNPKAVRLGVGRDMIGMRKDGTEIQLEIELTSINTSHGIQVLSSIVDVTARKKAETALVAERDRLRQILDSLFGFVALLSPDGRIEDINRAPLLLMGLQREEAIGRQFLEIGWVAPGHESRIQVVVQAAAKGEIVRTEVMARFATIGDRFIDTVFSPLREPEGRVIGVVVFGIDDTDRKQNEAALRTNEERLRLALCAAKQGLYDLDLTTGKAEVNDEYATMLGYEPGELDANHTRWAERLHPDERENVCRVFDAYIQGAIPAYEMEFRQRAKSGDWKWILSVGSIVERTMDGRPLRMLGTHLDITERKRAEEERHQTLTLLKNIINAIPDFIFVKDRQLRTILCNSVFAKAVGKDPKELIGRTDIENGWAPELVYGNSEKGIRGFERDDQDVLSGRVVHNPHDSANVNGHRRMFDTYKVPLVNESGEVMGVLGVSRDVTDRIKMEDELRDSEARLQEAQELAQIGNWELDVTSNRLIWSNEIFRIFEIDPTRFGASYEAFLHAIHPDDRALVNEAYSNSVAEHKSYAIVHRLLMADGRVKYVQELGETDYDDSGRAIRSRGTVQDVTVRRLAELQTETSLREKETLLREVHHRVKNNLQIISSLLYFQSKMIRDPEDLLAFKEGQDRLKSMILVHEKLYRSDDLMRIEFGDYAKALIDNIRQSYRPVSARIEVVTDIPPIVVPVEVALPAGMIVNELMSNVFKYAFPDERGGVVRISLARLDGGIDILVRDSGVGLPEGLDPQHPTTFGLQLIHGLTAQLGGQVSFDRQMGTGVRVSVPLPHG